MARAILSENVCSYICSRTNSKIIKRLTLGIMYYEWLGISLLLLLRKFVNTHNLLWEIVR